MRLVESSETHTVYCNPFSFFQRLSPSFCSSVIIYIIVLYICPGLAGLSAVLSLSVLLPPPTPAYLAACSLSFYRAVV